MSNCSRPAHGSPVVALFIVAATSCAVPGPPLEDCTYGRYHADCGGNGEAALGCDVVTGECRWFLGGIVADGYVASACSVDDVCCVRNGVTAWPFSSWSPGGSVLRTARGDLAVLAAYAVTSGTPVGVPVTYDPALADYVPPEAGFQTECADSYVCGFARSAIAIRGDSLVVSLFRADDTGGWVLEILPDGSGTLHARIIAHGLNRPFEYDPTAVDCGFTASAYELTGSMRIAPGSFENPAQAHGELTANIGPGTYPLIVRF